MRKILPPPGFDPRIAQTVEDRYTDSAIATHKFMVYLRLFVRVLSSSLLIKDLNGMRKHDGAGVAQ